MGAASKTLELEVDVSGIILRNSSPFGRSKVDRDLTAPHSQKISRIWGHKHSVGERPKETFAADGTKVGSGRFVSVYT